MVETQRRAAAAEFSPAQRRPLVLFKSLTDWMRRPHTVEGNVLYSECTNLNVNFFPNPLPGTSRITFDHISGHHGSAMSTHKIIIIVLQE